MFPRGSNTQLLNSSPTIIPSVKSSSTAAAVVTNANQATSTTGDGVMAVHAMTFDGGNFVIWRSVGAAAGNSAFVVASAGVMGSDTAGLMQRLESVGTLVDARTNTPTYNLLEVVTYGQVFNATTWDRTRSANGARNTTGTGLTGSGILGFDNTNWQAYGIINTGSGFALPIGGNQTGADGLGNTTVGYPNQAANFLAVADYLFNGSTWDRRRGGTDGTSLTGAGRVIPVASTFSNITTNTTTTAKASAGVIKGISINTGGTGSTVVLKDSATVIGTYDTTVVKSIELFDVYCATSIVAVTAGAVAADITVFYR